MITETLSGLFWMDGYGPYVWAAWCVAGIGLKGLLVFLLLESTRTQAELKHLTGNTRR